MITTDHPTKHCRQPASHLKHSTVLHSIAALLLLASYPLALKCFEQAVAQVSNTSTILSQCWSFLASCALFAPSVFGLYHLRNKRLDAPEEVTTRALLHILICAPVLYTAVVLAAYIFGKRDLTLTFWLTITILALAAATTLKPSITPTRYPSWLRVAHGILAATFLVSFASLHLANHSAALWSSTLHNEIQSTLRAWYLNRGVELLIFGLCMGLVTSGIYMASHHIRTTCNQFKRLQTATGSYLGLFLGVHITAILYARSQGIETNWQYASGAMGLLWSFHFLIPYYTLALLCFSLHGALAARQILIKHRMQPLKVQQIFFAIRILGLFMTIMIMTAALGFSLENIPL